MKLPIVETFSSINGEAPNVGKPSFFIRLHGCTLKCQFKGTTCDTPSAVYDTDEVISMDADELVDMIKAQPLKNITLTGGEALIYHRDLWRVLNKLDVFNVGFSDYVVEVETNGTISCPWKYGQVLYNISPKLKSSNQATPECDRIRINERALLSYPAKKSIFKFVLSSVGDLEEIKQIVKLREDIPVYLMPQGTTREEVLANSQAVVDVCLQEGWTFSPREHINIWNTRKKV